MAAPYERIARIVGSDKDAILKLDKRMSAITGMSGVLDKVVEESDALMAERMTRLGVSRSSSAKSVYDALISKIEADDAALIKVVGCAASKDPDHCRKILDKARTLANPPFGYFMKLEKFAELLEKEPPKKVMTYLGYSTVSGMLAKEDIFEIGAALRFIEGAEWLNGSFFKNYEYLTPEDFEFREIETRALGERWVAASEGFVKKKWHNISHLKELGMIFTLPVTLGISGELLRGMSLMLHYFNEVVFYSYLFARYAEHNKSNFALNICSLLRGDTIDERVTDGDRAVWMVIPRYFAKDDEHDWRLGEPHINPEAMHWKKAESTLCALPIDMSFWRDLDHVGDYMMSDAGIDVLVSFNLVDTVMSLVKRKELVKYLYHHQESLWNRVFASYVGEAEMEKMMKDHLLKGWFSI